MTNIFRHTAVIWAALLLNLWFGVWNGRNAVAHLFGDGPTEEAALFGLTALVNLACTCLMWSIVCRRIHDRKTTTDA